MQLLLLLMKMTIMLTQKRYSYIAAAACIHNFVLLHTQSILSYWNQL